MDSKTRPTNQGLPGAENPWLVLRVGVPSDEFGQTSLLINQAGSVTILNDHNGKQSRGAITLEPHLVQELAKNLESLEPKRRLGVPDEARITVQAAGAKEKVFWEGELEENPSIGKILGLLRPLVAKATQNQAIF